MSGPLERDAPALPSEASVGAMGTADLNPRDSETGQDDSGDLRARLAGLVRQPDDGSVSTPTEAYALRVADAVLAAGFRRVVEDEDTIERLAEALRRVDRDQRYDQLDDVFGEDAIGCGGAGHPEPCGGCVDCHRAMVANDLYSAGYCEWVRSMARAVVRALREDT